jgi:hypothetical protein
MTARELMNLLVQGPYDVPILLVNQDQWASGCSAIQEIVNVNLKDPSVSSCVVLVIGNDA